MYLSYLQINLGANPDRPRPARGWLRNRYRVHQRLCMAFPSAKRREGDPHFLKPFDPSDFEHAQTARTAQQGFLFRIDPLPGARAAILVQSAAEPDWDYAFHNADHFLAAPPQVKPYRLEFAPGQQWRFRLFANPVRRVSPRSLGANGEPLDPRWHGREVPVAPNDLEQWLQRRAEPGCLPQNGGERTQQPAGFRLVGIDDIQPGYVYVSKNGDMENARRRRSARYEGRLEITDAAAFRETLIRGIGPAKAFGFGLLSIAPA